jgi:hypothetical protein
MAKPKHRLISLSILIIISAHGLPILQKLLGKDQTLWPIMAWGMYRHSRGADGPIQTSIQRIIVTTTSGREREILPMDAGLSFMAFERQYMHGIRQGDAVAADRLIQRLNFRQPDPVVEIRLESVTYTVTESGLVEKKDPPFVHRSVN